MIRDAREAARAFDPVALARLESAAWIGVEWWRIHRALQHAEGGDTAELGAAVAALYAYTDDRPIDAMHDSGELRADAMRICDDWVAAGCDLNDARVAAMRRCLLRSYRSLKAAVA